MAEEENTAIVRQIYAAFQRKDVPGILDLQAEDSEWTVAASKDLIPWARPGSGRGGVKEFLRELSEWLIAEVFEIKEYLAAGETVVALGYQRGRVKPNGNPYEFDFVHVWKIRQEKVASFRVYYDTAYVGGVLHADRSEA